MSVEKRYMICYVNYPGVTTPKTVPSPTWPSIEEAVEEAKKWVGFYGKNNSACKQYYITEIVALVRETEPLIVVEYMTND